jgi:hypothetical protein
MPSAGAGRVGARDAPQPDVPLHTPAAPVHAQRPALSQI